MEINQQTLMAASSSRQKQSQKIMREKLAQVKRDQLKRKIQLITLGFVSLSIISGGIICWRVDAVSKTTSYVSNRFWSGTAALGFRLQHLTLNGRDRTSKNDIEQALALKISEPILGISLSQIKLRLEAIPSVKSAMIERRLPDTLTVQLIEREPVAVWQMKGELSLIDENGTVMKGFDMAQYRHLPLVIGEGAPEAVNEVLAMLSTDPALASRFKAAIRTGNRRWNMRLSGGVDIKLPEEKPIAAWTKLARLQREDKLLDRAVESVDLRLPDRLFVKTTPQPVMPQKTNMLARET